METTDNKKLFRDRLSILASQVHHYSNAIRMMGFSCAHIREDWIEKNFSSQDILDHKNYLVEFARVALCADSSANVIYDDHWETGSQLINTLKQARYKTYGSVDELFKDSKTRHLVQLSPCLRELSRIAECGTADDLQQEKLLMQEFLDRRDRELRLHSEQINCLISEIKDRNISSKTELQKYCSEQVVRAFQTDGAELHEVAETFGLRHSVSFGTKGNVIFLIIPIISSDGINDGGTVGMAFRLADIDILQTATYSQSNRVVLHLSSLLPSSYINYGRFDSAEEFCLNLIAWIAAIKVMLPDIINQLRGGGERYQFKQGESI